MKTVVVFAGSAIGSVLSLLEQIKQENNCTSYVICLNSNAQSALGKSTFVDHVVNLQYADNQDFFSKFKIWCINVEFKSKPVVYFTTDTSCFLVNQYREWFDDHFILCLPSSELINTYTKKGDAEVAAEENGLPIPRTYVLKDCKDVKQVEKEFEFPVIIKPRSTYETLASPFKVKILEREAFYEETVALLGLGHTFVCQEYIPGNDDSAYFFIFYRSKKQKINYVVGRKILQSPPRAGIMAKGLIEENFDLADQSIEFLNNIDYSGIGGIEFKKHNGKYYFIEMSTRLEGFFKISSIAKVPLGSISFSDLAGTPIAVNSLQRNNGIYIDLISMIVAHKKNKNFKYILKDFLSVLFNKKVQLNVYSKKDKLPFFATLKNMFL